MTYHHAMETTTEGIHLRAPLRYRMLDGMVADFWQASGQPGAEGYRRSPDPRIVVFFSEIERHVQMAGSRQHLAGGARPIRRIMYVPAGVPMWTGFARAHDFDHLDVHLHPAQLRAFLQPAMGAAGAGAALARPVEMDEAPEITALARLVVDELGDPRRNPLFAETLLRSMVAGLLTRDGAGAPPTATGGLSPAQLHRLEAHLDRHMDRGLPIAELAQVAGLSESWFARVFKQSMGETPLAWQQRRRIERAQQMLRDGALAPGDVAAALGFADQSHLTRVFRKHCGQTPAAWRRAQP